jgi:Tfp pilus assembly protein PilO
MADSSRSTIILLALIAVLAAYMGYTGDGLRVVGVPGLKVRVDQVQAERDSLADLQTRIDAAKRNLARESLDQVKARVDSFRASLAVLRSLVPDQTEVANLIDDVAIRARVHGVTLSGFVPNPPIPGPSPFDTQSYQWTAVGRFNNIGAFLTDVASLRRIIVPTDVGLSAANLEQARVLGDTTAMLEAHFTMRTYVKAKASEDSTNGQ